MVTNSPFSNINILGKNYNHERKNIKLSLPYELVKCRKTVYPITTNPFLVYWKKGIVNGVSVYERVVGGGNRSVTPNPTVVAGIEPAIPGPLNQTGSCYRKHVSFVCRPR